MHVKVFNLNSGWKSLYLTYSILNTCLLLPGQESWLWKMRMMRNLEHPVTTSCFPTSQKQGSQNSNTKLPVPILMMKQLKFIHVSKCSLQCLPCPFWSFALSLSGAVRVSCQALWFSLSLISFSDYMHLTSNFLESLWLPEMCSLVDSVGRDEGRNFPRFVNVIFITLA